MPNAWSSSTRPCSLELERGSLIAAAFALSLDFCVPDLLYQRELARHDHRLLPLGLKVLELDGPGVLRAVRYRRVAPALSVFGVFALALANRTGAGLLRRLATEEGVTCHGLLWLIDHMYCERTASLTELRDALVILRDHARC